MTDVLPEDSVVGEGFAMFCWFRHKGSSRNGLSDVEYSRLAYFWWITGGYR